MSTKHLLHGRGCTGPRMDSTGKGHFETRSQQRSRSLGSAVGSECFLVPSAGSVPSANLTAPSSPGIITHLIFQVRKPRLREVKVFAQGHMDSKWRIWDLIPSPSHSEGSRGDTTIEWNMISH